MKLAGYCMGIDKLRELIQKKIVPYSIYLDEVNRGDVSSKIRVPVSTWVIPNNTPFRVYFLIYALVHIVIRRNKKRYYYYQLENPEIFDIIGKWSET